MDPPAKAKAKAKQEQEVSGERGQDNTLKRCSAVPTPPTPTPTPTPVLNVPSVRFRVNEEDEAVTYLCGDCGEENTLQPGNIIQCRECGYRVLYKKRTRRIIEYQAR